MQTVPVIVLYGLSEIERRQLVLADNRIAANARWDMEMLRLELKDLSELTVDLRSRNRPRVMAAAPGFSPLLGGALDHMFGWRSEFAPSDEKLDLAHRRNFQGRGASASAGKCRDIISSIDHYLDRNRQIRGPAAVLSSALRRSSRGIKNPPCENTGDALSDCDHHRQEPHPRTVSDAVC
jgi:hypothetical protein